jgi:hypothetical protein
MVTNSERSEKYGSVVNLVYAFERMWHVLVSVTVIWR